VKTIAVVAFFAELGLYATLLNFCVFPKIIHNADNEAAIRQKQTSHKLCHFCLSSVRWLSCYRSLGRMFLEFRLDYRICGWYPD